jgi:hypothetical protein
MKSILILLLLSCSVVMASETTRFRVHYSVKGSGRDVIVLAESSAEARRTVMEIFPGAVVSGVRRSR